jgi:phosphatidylethanolamine/phosphatidyl-N-methylethanolamine N-methyltransferase
MNWVKWNQFRYRLYAPFYDVLLILLNKKRAECLQSIPFTNHSRIALVGCGTGLDLEYLPRKSSILAMDLTRKMLQIASKKGLSRGFDSFFSIQMNAETLALKSNSVDFIILSLIIAVVNDPNRCMQEAIRVLKPGGTMVIMDKFVGTKVSFFRRVFSPLAKLIATDLTCALEPLLHDQPLILKQDCAFYKIFRCVQLQKM